MGYAEETLERLGNYFVENNIRERFNITFEYFVEQVVSGVWGKV